MNGRFVAYYRVSKASQGKEGLGMEAQERAVANFLNGGRWEVVESFKEVESGGRSDRPEMAKAIALCKATGAKLLIAKLDRLARDIRFLTLLDDAKVEFVCADMPDANRTVIGFMMVMAQAEREAISARTKAGLQSIKERIAATGQHVSKKGNVITKLGGPKQFSEDHRAKAVEAVRAKADDHAAKVAPIIASMRSNKATLQQIADALNQSGLKTPRGASWTPIAVSRAHARAR